MTAIRIQEWRFDGVLTLLALVSQIPSLGRQGMNDFLLSQDEQVRFDSLSHPLRRRQFLAGRWLAREAGRRYLDAPGNGFSVSAGENGAPTLLRDAVPIPGLHLSISHSEDWCAVAVANDRIGVDVQAPIPLARWEAVSSKVFALQELEWIRASEGKDRAGRFARIWSLKEAYGKRMGIGLQADRFRNMAFFPGGTPFAEAFTRKIEDEAILALSLKDAGSVSAMLGAQDWEAWALK